MQVLSAELLACPRFIWNRANVGRLDAVRRLCAPCECGNHQNASQFSCCHYDLGFLVGDHVGARPICVALQSNCLRWAVFKHNPERKRADVAKYLHKLVVAVQALDFLYKTLVTPKIPHVTAS
jgi:hypothetical protein